MTMKTRQFLFLGVAVTTHHWRNGVEAEGSVPGVFRSRNVCVVERCMCFRALRYDPVKSEFASCRMFNCPAVWNPTCHIGLVCSELPTSTLLRFLNWCKACAFGIAGGITPPFRSRSCGWSQRKWVAVRVTCERLASAIHFF